MKITHQGLSSPGLKRGNNEDFFAAEPELGFYVVCDGVGGHNRGEVASELCASQMITQLRGYRDQLQQFAERPLTRELRENVRQILQKCVGEANRILYERANSVPQNQGMACTLVGLLNIGNFAWIVHVGDSRAYVVREKKWNLLTEDHRFVTELLKKGVITGQQAKDHPQRNVLVKAMGTQAVVEPDFLEIETAHGDRFLLCTDGLSDYFEKDLTKVPWESQVSVWAEKLVAFANASGGKDNITVVVLDLAEDENTARTPRQVSVLEKFSLVGKVPVFRFLNYSEIAKVMALTNEKTFPMGALLVEEGTASDEWYILAGGTVEVEKQGARVTELKAGASFGEMGVFDSAPRSASVRALEKVITLVIPAKDLIALFKKEHYLAMKILWAEVRELNQRLRTTTYELAQLMARQEDLSPFEETSS